MEYENLATEACDIHINYAKELYKVTDTFLSGGKLRVLLWLSRQESPCAADVIDHFGLSAGRVSNILKALESEGYLVRRQSKDDHRRAYIDLTPSGVKRAEAIYANLHNLFQEFFAKLGYGEAREFLDFEKRLLEMITDGTIVIAPPDI